MWGSRAGCFPLGWDVPLPFKYACDSEKLHAVIGNRYYKANSGVSYIPILETRPTFELSGAWVTGTYCIATSAHYSSIKFEYSQATNFQWEAGYVKPGCAS